MASNFEQLVFEIIATDKNASAAFDRFRGTVDKTSRSIDDNTGKLDKNTKSLDSVAKSAGNATPLLGGLAGTGGMGALIGAGVVLSPLITTMGFGLAGFGLAAAKAVAPVFKAAQSTGGLAANMTKLNPEQQKVAQSLLGLGKQYDAFAKSLEPQVLTVFGKGLQLAGHLMHDVQPIAKATGTALGSLLDRVDKEFQSGQWQSFFSWMAANVGPDFQMVGNLAIDLLKSLPQVLELLQPTASAFVKVADAAIRAAGAYAKFIQAEAHKGDQPGSFGKQIRDLAHDLLRTSVNSDKLKAAQEALDKRFADGKIAAGDLIHPIGTFTSGLQSAKVATDNEQRSVTLLTNALKGLSSGLLTGEQDQVAWKQAQQAATQAIKANTGSLNSNRGTALAARSAIIQSTQAALTFANQEINLHHNTDAASAVIRAQINWLQTHAGKSRIAAAEVNALRGALAQLHSKAITITESGVGHFSIFGRNTTSTPKLAGGAQGLFINRGTTPTADDVLIRASKGELVVPTKMVSAGLVDHLRGMIPGFASGGLAALPGRTASFDSSFQAQFTAAMKSAMTAAMRAAISAARAAAVGALGGPTSASAAQAQAYARSRLGAYGWGSGQMGSLIALWNQESGWNRLARNQSSGAYGIPQALPPGKMGAAANPPTSSAAAQINWGLGYIRGRYGSPAGAEAHERAFNWYDRGGWMPPGPSLSYNGTGRPEAVVGGAPLARVEALLAQILAAVKVAPAATSVGLTRALNGMVPR